MKTSQRQFRFRVWDKLEERFIDSSSFNQGHYMITLNGEFHNLQNGSGGYDYVIQQYTGLKDKNGVEIYEGDIVRGEFFDTDYMGDILVTCPVIWVEERACFNIGNHYWTHTSIKLVGNIFEGIYKNEK